MRHESTKDDFNENDDAYTLFNQYIDWVKKETGERKKIDLLYRALHMIQELGTTDGYTQIFTKDDNIQITYLIPYLPNKASIKILNTALKKVTWTDETKGGSFETRCPCGILLSTNFDRPIHNGQLYKKLMTKAQVETKFRQKKDFALVKNMVDIDTLREILSEGCPYTIMDNSQNLAKILM